MTNPILETIAAKAWPKENPKVYAAELAKIIRVINDCGFEVVPAAPTEEMVHAAVMTHVRENKGIEHSPYLSYKSMIAAGRIRGD